MAPDTMFAVRKMHPQRGVELGQIAIPQCRPYEVLVQLRATSVCGTDVHIYNWDAWDARQVDIVAAVLEHTDGDGADVLLEMSGNALALQQGLQAPTQGGRASLLGIFVGPVSLDLDSQVILKDIRMYGITGRHMFATWYKAARFLRAGLLDPSPIITHRFALRDFERAMELIAQGQCGKVILLPT